MTHTICASDAGEGLAYVQRLWRALLSPGTDPSVRLERLLETEADELGLEYGFVSRIDVEGGTERFEITHGSHGTLQPATTVPLSRTYCRRTITDPGGTVAISDALAEGWGDDPAYETFGLGSYLGTTLTVDDELYGTLCFANAAPRGDPITDEERTLVELHAQWVADTLSLRSGRPARERSLDAVERCAAAPDDVDSMLDALAHPARRVVLGALLGDATGISAAALERRLDDADDGLRLHHVDLPKLAAAGYVAWDDDAEVVSAGPKFPEIEPLVRLVRAYDATFSV
jgi:GAF domain-containing protein